MKFSINTEAAKARLKSTAKTITKGATTVLKSRKVQVGIASFVVRGSLEYMGCGDTGAAYGVGGKVLSWTMNGLYYGGPTGAAIGAVGGLCLGVLKVKNSVPGSDEADDEADDS